MTTRQPTDSRAPSAWESVVVSKMRPKIVKMAKGVRGLHHVGWTEEDVQNEMLIAVVKACRSWAVARNTEPEPGYVMRAVVRRRYRIWERVAKAYKEETLNRTDLLDENNEQRALGLDHAAAGDNTPSQPDHALAQSIVAHNHGSVVYALRQRLEPDDFAMLQLRSMDFSTRDIAEVMGLLRDGTPDHQEVSRQLYRIRRKASEFLRQLGIHTLEDAEHADRRSLFDARQQD